ncbi:Acetyltransferase (GNAT) family protein [Glycomyces sambucus]|uniref:Acetyltransferase (GNAT) family protein n=1 Tax=Glycomyces sambucus TaxID=380244 RepID=A0A1G9MR45_9ACTN|nr:GNAT family N-acetyltransferase [Glycomyces sambucus]SDL76730.1 Acetyltransferase (GNAT) family protein [Glycomyces sambucus]
MQLTPLNPSDHDGVGAVLGLVNAVRNADAPEGPGIVEQSFRAGLRQERPGLDIVHFAATEDGTLVGYLGIGLMVGDNPHLAMAELMVHPDHRHRGHGRAMLDHYTEYASSRGRTDLTAGTLTTWGDGPRRPEAGVAFLERNDFTLALVNVRRRARTDALAPEDEQRLWAEARAASEADYDLRTWTGPAPDDLIESICRLDAKSRTEIPLGDIEMEAEAVDVARARAKEAATAAVHQVPVKAAAVHRATGEVAAITDVHAFEDPAAVHASQGITIADPAHRGHRLGMLVKLANLRRLREQFPRVAEIWTENADVNDRMVAINTALGYEAVDALSVYQRRLRP